MAPVGSRPSATLLPTEAELATIEEVPDVRAWAGLSGSVWRAVDERLGGVQTLRVLASLSASAVRGAALAARLPDGRALSAVEQAQVALTWRAARCKFNLPDEDPLRDGAGDSTSQHVGTVKTRGRTTSSRGTAPQPRTLRLRRPRAEFPPPVSRYGVHPLDGDCLVLQTSVVGGVDAFASRVVIGMDCVQQVPQARWDHAEVFGPDQESVVYTQHGAFLADMEVFDSTPFGISRWDASQMDPQQRKCLEAGREVLHGADSAGASTSSVGVYVGVMTYDWLTARASPDTIAMSDLPQMFANRISHQFGLTGPSMTLDTACSSSLVAVGAAAEDVAQRCCDLALAVGVCHMGSPHTFISRCAARFLSTVGRSLSFDASADGYCRGEGCGAVLLGRCGNARRSTTSRRTPIIAGHAVNEDGRSASLTAPNGSAQQALLQDACRAASVPARDISCTECAANGSPLGDPIEFGALARMHSRAPSADAMVLGSAKTMKGHTEGASGVTGLIKSVLLLQRRVVAPILHLRSLNGSAELGGPLIASEAVALSKGDAEAHNVGVSAFGFGGTNAHAVLRAAV
mmetsp:Transcript_73443/g.203986  ORF Transcript_73443/g.203986 Transcript_73443/m.203986 type:complete len:574 (-) Transcript_73443:32-1753(-)